jgi:hypothetical protein
MTMLFALVFIGLHRGPTPVNDLVVDFARSKLGQKVGSGECTALAREALRHAGAKPPGRGLASWGEEVDDLKDARPGDILQFENAVFVRRRLREDGARVTLTFNYPHHTAIVSSVKKRGPKPILVILHQNAGVAGGDEGETKVVQEWTVNMAEMKRGDVKAYRPVTQEPQARSSPARRGQDRADDASALAP